MTSHRNVVCAIAALTFTQIALAQVITVSPSGYAPANVPAGGDITIDATNATNGEAFVVSTSNGTADIGTITVNVGNHPNPSSPSRYIVVSVSGVTNLKGVVKGTGSGELIINSLVIRKDIGSETAPRGTISASRIDSISGGRNLFATIAAAGSSVFTTDLYAIGTVEATGNNRDFNTDGNITSDITAGLKGISLIKAFNSIGGGSLITSTGPVGLITAAGLSDVDIDMPTADLAELQTTAGGWGGDQVYERRPLTDPNPAPPIIGQTSAGGTLNVRTLGKLEIYENIAKTTSITMAQPIDPTAVWRIGKSLGADASIVLPANGLKHQIVIGARGVGGTYDGVVKVGNTNLRNLYSPIPSTIGGGAAGEVAYKQHGPASTPAKDAIVAGSRLDLTSTQEPPPCLATILNTLEVEFYGKIDLPGSPPAADVVSVIGWNPRVNGGPVTTYTPTAVDINTRRLRITLQQHIGYDQTIAVTIKPNKVRCLDLVMGAANVFVPEFTDYFSITGAKCEDLFGLCRNGRVGWEDLATYLGEPVDFDENGVINDRDASILIRGISEQPQQP